LGLLGMQERVEALGGAYVIESEAAAAPAFASRSRAVELRRGPRRRIVTSVLIIDDHPIVLQGCRRILEDAHVDPCLKPAMRCPVIGATAGISRTWW